MSSAEQYDPYDAGDQPYLVDLSRPPVPLNAEEEVELAQRIELGKLAASQLQSLDEEGLEISAESRSELESRRADGDASRRFFIASSIGLVRKAAHGFARVGIEFDDLVQYGTGALVGVRGPIDTGLSSAVDNFDYRHRARFSSYAMPWITTAIKLGISMHHSTIRVPRYIVQQVRTLDNAEDKNTLPDGTPASDDIIAAALGVTTDELAEMRTTREHYWQAVAPKSLDQPLPENNDLSYAGVIVDTTTSYDFEKITDDAEITWLLGQLTARQQFVVKLRHGLEDGVQHDERTVADRVGYTVPALRQDLAKAREAVRQALLSSLDYDPEQTEQRHATTIREQIRQPAEMTFGELVEDPRHAIAVERMLALCGPSVANLVVDRFPSAKALLDDLSLTSISPIHIKNNVAQRRLQRAETMLREIIDGTFDYAEWQSSPGRPRHVLGFMAKAGQDIPPDASVQALRQAARELLSAAEYLPERTREVIAAYYGLEGAQPLAAGILAKRYRISVQAVSQLAERGIIEIASSTDQESDRSPRAVEQLAAEVQLEQWFSDPRLRITLERALSMLPARQSAALIGRYASDKPGSNSGMSRQNFNQAVYAGSRQLELFLPSIAAGAYDLEAWKESRRYNQSILEFLLRTGSNVPADSNLAKLRSAASKQVEATLSLNDIDNALLGDYFDLDGQQGAMPTAEIARKYCISDQSVIKRVAAALRVLQRENSKQDVAGRVEPTLSAHVLRDILRNAQAGNDQTG